MRVIGIIPARGGSKGVIRKNIAPILNKPLIAYTIEAAQGAKLLTDVVVSTDDEQIAAISTQFGVLAPFIRPAHLAQDDTPTLPVVQHAVEFVETANNCHFDIIVLLQPTTPLRTSEDIDATIDLLQSTRADSVVSVVDVGGYHPFRMKRIIGKNILVNYIDQDFEDMRPRQKLPPVYIRSGDLYVNWRQGVMEAGWLVGKDVRAYIIPKERAVNIDTEFDLQLAEYLLQKRMR
jgi:CMP-N,N'-diacetyllegionaminic acid synthase